MCQHPTFLSKSILGPEDATIKSVRCLVKATILRHQLFLCVRVSDKAEAVAPSQLFTSKGHAARSSLHQIMEVYELVKASPTDQPYFPGMVHGHDVLERDMAEAATHHGLRW